MSKLIIYCPSCGLHWLFTGGFTQVKALCTACDQECRLCLDADRCPQAAMHGIADMKTAVRLWRGLRRP